MTELDYFVGLVLPHRDYRFIDKTIQNEHGIGIEDIAQQHGANAAFDALESGITACYTRRGHNQIVHAKPDLTPTGVIDRAMDGEHAFGGVFAQVSHMMVGNMVTRFFEEQRDIAIETVKNPGILSKKIGRQPTRQIVSVIPFSTAARQ